MGNQNKQEIVAMEQQQLTCVQKHIAKGTTIPVKGKALKQPDIAAAYANHVSLLKQAEAAREKWLALVAQERAAAVALKPITKVVGAYFENTFGEGSEEAIEFGLSARKVTSQKVQEKSLAVAKRLATRKARHTMGKKERLEIHGNVDESGDTSQAVTTPANVAAPPVQPTIIMPAKSNGSANGATNGASNGYLNGAANGATNGSG
jgi:hypothetical protein